MKNLIKSLLVLALAGVSTAAHAQISFTCDAATFATYDAPTSFCGNLSSIVAAQYSALFSKADADILIKYSPTTGLGDSTTGEFNVVSYNVYLAALTAASSGDLVDTAALASLAKNGTPGTDISITSALAETLGIQNTDDLNGNTVGVHGIEADGTTECNIGAAGCFNGIVELATPANLAAGGGQGLYYGTDPNAVPANDYDVYSVIEHETNELLGTSSCFSVNAAPQGIANNCGGDVSETDLFRYNAEGQKVYADAQPGAYFSYDGGATAVGPVYNTTLVGEDYADFYPASDAIRCGSVQSAEGCLGGAPSDTTDGGAEATILDAIGYNRNTGVSPTPEPGSIALLGTGIAAIGGLVRRRRTR